MEKPLSTEGRKYGGTWCYICPLCKSPVWINEKHFTDVKGCPNCKELLDWSDEVIA